MKQRLYHILINLVALSLLSYLGVDIFYRLLTLQWTGVQVLKTGEVAMPEKARKQRPPLKDFDVIVDRNIFGSAQTAVGSEKTPDMPKEDIEALEPTSLNVVLLGTVTGTEEDARAVIEDSSRKMQGLYRVGDSIQNAVIQRIVRGKVVLRVREKNEVLSMEPPESGSGRSAAEATPSGDKVTLARSDIHESLQNINQLLTQARIRPYLTDGKPDGFILSYIKPDSFFTQLGLRLGDVVKSINGKPINTPEDAFSFYKAVESGDALSMEILRGGQPQTIQYEFK